LIFSQHFEQDLEYQSPKFSTFEFLLSYPVFSLVRDMTAIDCKAVITQKYGLQKLGKAVKIQQTYNRRDFSKLILIFCNFSGKLPIIFNRISAPYKLSYYTLWLRVRTGERM